MAKGYNPTEYMYSSARIRALETKIASRERTMHLADADSAESVLAQLSDFGFEMICQGRFTTAQIDKNTWSEEMLDMLLDWIKNDPRGEEYRDLDWSKEYDLARNGDPNDTQSAL